MESNIDNKKMQLIKDFNDFLKGDDVFTVFNHNNNKTLIVKIPFNSKIDILYSFHSYNEDIFDLNSKLEYSGFYDKANDKLYDVGYIILYNILGYETAKDIMSKSTLCEKISNEVGNRVSELVDEDRELLFGDGFTPPEINDYDKPRESDVKTYFIDGLTSTTYPDQFRNYSTNAAKDVLDYITNPEDFIEQEAREYILNNINDIYLGLFKSEEIRKQLKKIEDNKENPLYKVKDIVDSIRDKDYKTVNLTINKNGIEQTFKYEASPLLYSYDSYLSTYNFVSAKERAEFVENFGWREDLHYKDIVKITYGKNVVYEDEKFKENQLEESICL